MSASSNCVTCGMFTQLACRRGPEIFWMRDSGLVSTGPNFEKSTAGMVGRPVPPPFALAPRPPAGAPPLGSARRSLAAHRHSSKPASLTTT